jgi:hypothetical protein
MSSRYATTPSNHLGRRQRWNQRSVTSAQLSAEYGFTDIDGSRPDVWRYNQDVEAGKLDANPSDYR